MTNADSYRHLVKPRRGDILVEIKFLSLPKPQRGDIYRSHQERNVAPLGLWPLIYFVYYQNAATMWL
jgi:hypothetical protein